ncbi:hypothetical protein [Bifidobacterium angulatum]|uniref:hypothetical protein n=1 Tax=Bifidobacterium angulatum TaxID=1683 RepID=UPI003AAAA302
MHDPTAEINVFKRSVMTAIQALPYRSNQSGTGAVLLYDMQAARRNESRLE